MRWWWDPLCPRQRRRVGFHGASSLKQQSTGRHVAPHGHIILIPSQAGFALTPYWCVPSGEATNTNFKVFGLTRPGLEPTIYRTRGEHANHYTTDAVLVSSNFIQQSGTTNVKTKSCISDTFEVTSVVMSTPICIQDDLHLSVYRTTSVNDYYNDYYLNLPRMSTLGYYHELFVNIGIGLGLCRFTPRSTIFQLFGNDQFYWWRKPTDLLGYLTRQQTKTKLNIYRILCFRKVIFRNIILYVYIFWTLC